MSTLFPPPWLATLHTKPTWHNRAGRVDRSACLVLTAAQHWRQVPDDDWTYRYPARQTACRAKGKCDRYADLTFCAHDLWVLHKWEQPYPLQGDFRTAKANALRHTPRPLGRRGDRPCAQQMRNDAVLGQGPINPNRGGGFNQHKMLGLGAMWQTTLRIERYVQHAKLKQHFFVCPVCGQQPNSPRPTDAGHENIPLVISSGVRRPPAISTARTGKLPTGRVTKLYLPLCTRREYYDAQFARLWLDTHTNPNRPLSKQAVQLIERYGELFGHTGERPLRCRQCLGLRYGEVKARLEG